MKHLRVLTFARSVAYTMKLNLQLNEPFCASAPVADQATIHSEACSCNAFLDSKTAWQMQVIMRTTSTPMDLQHGLGLT